MFYMEISMNNRGILLLMLLYLSYVSTVPHRHRRISNEKTLPKKHYCGEDLVKILDLVCDGNYAEGGKFRNVDFKESHVEASDDKYKYPFIQRKSAESLVPLRVRRDDEESKNSIVEQCCYNECSNEELILYCG